jgi:hypothetical protein
MSYGRRVAVFVGVMVIVAALLIISFILSAREAVDGARWDIQIPDVPSWGEV